MGIIAADGCVYIKENRTKVLAFAFHEQERDILEIIKHYMCANYNIKQASNNHIQMQINSNKIVEDLAKYNIHPRKTWDYEPINIPQKYIWHFIRGYFDGDGSVWHKRNYHERPSEWYVNFCGNYQTILWLQKQLAQYDINVAIREDKREKYSHKFYYIVLSNTSSIYNFIKLLYKDSENLRLSRKYNKCMEYEKLYNLRHPN